MKKRIYITGKIGGLPRAEVVRKFDNAKLELFIAGFEPISPVDLNAENTTWQAAMRTDIAAMMYCDAVLVLPCSEDSPGAAVEMDLAGKLGIPMFTCIQTLSKHFRKKQENCKHIPTKRVIGGAVTCEETALFCSVCHLQLTEPETDC